MQIAAAVLFGIVVLSSAFPGGKQTVNIEDVECTMQRISGVTVTAYTNAVEETDSTPDITSTGSKVRTGIGAASRDFIKGDVPYGAQVCFSEHYWPGWPEPIGDWQSLVGHCVDIEDTMHPRKKRQIDYFTFDKNEALRIGRGTATIVVTVCSDNEVLKRK